MADTETICVEGPAGQLEACFTQLSRAGDAGVICHPHPLYGGSMDDAIVCALETGMQNRGLSTVRFNFRGVGGSEGSHDRGVGEVDDVTAVIKSSTPLRCSSGWQHYSHLLTRLNSPMRTIFFLQS